MESYLPKAFEMKLKLAPDLTKKAFYWFFIS